MKAIFGIIMFVSGIVLAWAAPAYVIKFLYDLFAMHVPFWTALFTNAWQCILVEIVAYFVCAISAGIICSK